MSYDINEFLSHVKIQRKTRINVSQVDRKKYLNHKYEKGTSNRSKSDEPNVDTECNHQTLHQKRRKKNSLEKRL